jgi:uncharacterized radical SAM protein YgiQ
MIVYGMGEQPVVEIARRLEAGEPVAAMTDVRQSVVRRRLDEVPAADAPDAIVLNSWRRCLRDKKAQAANFRHIEQQSNRLDGGVALWQAYDDMAVCVNPMHPAMTTAEIDASFDLPYTRLPHPRYRGKTIPAYEMIKFSVNIHRGCFGGCAFCTISAHQGKHIASRSRQSILREVKQVAAMPGFKGYLSDLGGPSANMYGMHGKDLSVCAKCMRPSCLHPKPCPNLNSDHGPLLDLYHAVDALPGIKKSFIGSGVRYDLSMAPTGDARTDANNRRYNRELIERHVSGRLKVAPEHTSDSVVNIMRKPRFELFRRFKEIFDDVNEQAGLRQQIIPYFISSHPGCHEADMAELAVMTKDMGLKLEQVQDFTPTPMTLSTEIYYTGYHPYTLEPVFTARTDAEKQAQRKYFFWYDPACRADLADSLHRLHRPDLARKLFPGGVPRGRAASRQPADRRPPKNSRRKR